MILIDHQRAIHGRPHGSFVKRVVAALSAEPETIEELGMALDRFTQPGEWTPFERWSAGACDEPYDAGICIIDLAARLVVCESTYSAPGPQGEVDFPGEEHESAVWVSYHLSDDWLFLHDLEGWQTRADKRRAERSAQPPIDVREALYNKVVEHIVEECFAAREGVTPGEQWKPSEGWSWRGLPEKAESDEPSTAYDAVAEIHARWLMTPRDDLRGESPRDVLLTKRDFLTWDLQDRQIQWTTLGECPPPLSRESAAFQFAGMGIHENVLYYDLVRNLIWECWVRVVEPGRDRGDSEPTLRAREHLPAEPTEAEEIADLDRLKDQWLSSRQNELQGRSPAEVIETERLRLPPAVSGEAAMIDPDCPLCRMMGEGKTPMFWHLDGSHLDMEFPFSSFATREEWEEEQRRWEEFDREFDRKWKQREAERELAENTPTTGDDGGPSIWKSSFSNPSPDESPSVQLFGIGGHLAELITDLKEHPDTQPLVDRLNRQFGNLHEMMMEPSDALLEPVVERFCDELNETAEAHPDLIPKCTDLDRQLREFLKGLSEPPSSDIPDWDEDVPF